jgi:biopolymer transport protein ExbD
VIHKLYLITGVIFSLIIFGNCSGKKTSGKSDIIITISVKNKVVVNSDTVDVKNLDNRLEQLGVTHNDNIRVVPDPEAGPAMVEEVQRKIRIYKQSH